MSFTPELPTSPSLTVLERPVLRLGLLGFGLAHRELIRQVLRSRAQTQPARPGVVWELAELADADAWWVHGPSARGLGDGSVEVASAEAGRTIRFYPREVDRPLGWSLPVAGAISADVVFNVDLPGSIEGTLLRLEQMVRPLTAQLCLASQLLQREAELGSRVYHVHAKGRLLAVVDLRGDTAVRPTATLRELAGAFWSARASAAHFPEDFVRTSLSMLMWQYATRTRENLLPHRYRLGLIYVRRAPRLPQRLLKDVHLLLLRQLAVKPRTFVELLEETGLAPSALSHGLAALYLVGAVTSNPKRARTLGEAALHGGGLPSVSPSGIGPLDSRPAQADSTSQRAFTQ